MKLIEYIKEKRIDKIVDKYSKLFLKEIDSNKSILIEAFIKYYGEEYRNIITERLNNTYFYIFISDATIKQIKKLIAENIINNTDIIRNIKKIIKYYGKNHITAKFYCNGEDVQSKSVKNYTTEYFSNKKNSVGGHIVGTTIFNDQSSLIFISFSQYFYDETALIHEINHAIRSSNLAIYVDNNGKERIITKNGIDIKNSESNECIEIEEIIQHKATLEILDFFHKLGGHISIKPTNHLTSKYEKMFPLIENFYKKYETILKKAAITDNINVLFSEIDKDKYEEYKRVICEQFPIIYDDNNNLSDKVINYVNNLVNQIGKKENKKENIHKFIEELKASGKTINFFNSNVEENNETKNKQR